MTSPKPLKDKLYQVPTSGIDKHLDEFLGKTRINYRPINKLKTRSRLNIWTLSHDQNVQIYISVVFFSFQIFALILCKK